MHTLILTTSNNAKKSDEIKAKWRFIKKHARRQRKSAFKELACKQSHEQEGCNYVNI
jgi:hypothetical protein